MNVNAEIVVEDVKNVLSVPVEAVSRATGFWSRRIRKKPPAGRLPRLPPAAYPKGLNTCRLLLASTTTSILKSPAD